MTPPAGSLPEVVAPATDGLTAKPVSLWADTRRNILRQRVAQVGLILLGSLLAIALAAPLIATHDPFGTDGIDEGLVTSGQLGPCIHLFGCPKDRPEHFFGIDRNGRDEYSRVIYGARVSLLVGIATVSFAILVGTLLGSVAGYAGGWLDNVIMRLMDVLLAFPSLILAIAMVTVLGPGLLNAGFAIGIVGIPIYARVMRASVLSIKERDFVVATRALGESSRGILLRRILPNALTPLIVVGTLGIAGAILDVAALSFLGLGAQAPTAEWGSMIGLDRNQLFSAPHLIVVPGIALSLSVLGFNLLGDGLRDALDPRLNR
jgi:ABC-type dipeptide/oligopeptide/nickel transport system permease subunit